VSVAFFAAAELAVATATMMEPHQLGREVGKPVKLTPRKTIVDDDILPFNPPEVVQSLSERLI
jgi:hypothetical protein